LYGIKIHSPEDKFVRLLRSLARIFGDATEPGAFLVDTLPILKYVPSWFPFSGFKRQAKIWAKTVQEAREESFGATKHDVAEGVHNTSFTANILRDAGSEGIHEELEYLSGSLLAGSVDTTSATIGTFIRAMVLHPEVQEHAQQEIESVIGHDRLPTFSDREKLPYVEAILKETLRWQPVAPMSVPYRSSEDFVYEGYFIPKDSIVTANSWHIARDETLYPNAEAFNPERFIGPTSSQLTSEEKAPLDPTTYVFGYGRRICPGMHFADQMVWFTMVTLLATTRILPKKDSEGNDIMPKLEYSGTMVREILPAPYHLEPLSPKHASLVLDRLANVE